MFRLFKVFILICFSLFIGLGIGEFLLRQFFPQQLILIRSDIWCQDSQIGWKICPNVSTRVNSGDGEIFLHSDEDGHRYDPSHVIDHPERRVLVIGDSFMEAIQVEDDQTLSAVLANNLAKKLGKKVLVENAGVGNYDPNHYLAVAALELDKVLYDLGLVFIYLGNDIVDRGMINTPRRSVAHELHFPRAFNRKEIIDALLYPFDDYFESHSHVYVLLKRASRVALMRLGLTGNSIAPVFFKAQKDMPQFAATADLCLDIQNKFKKNGVPVLFVLIPTSYQVEPDIFAEHLKGFDIPAEQVDVEQPNQVLGQLLLQRGIEVLDPLNDFRQHVRDEPLFGKVDNHLNAAGHALLAHIVLPWVMGRLGERYEFKD